MKEKMVSLYDKHSISDFLINNEVLNRISSGKVKKTKITITDHDTGIELGTYENKVLITGSMFSGCRLFGIDTDLVLPSYNDEMHFYKDQPSPVESRNYNKSFVQLFCVGDDGCGATQRDVRVCNYTDRIRPLTDITDPQSCIGGIYPFRYVDIDSDLPEQLRNYYFGRKTYTNKIAYYFKKFDTTPQLHVKYTDGTQVDDNMYITNTDQVAECYVETRLRITRNDFRDFFEDVIGWDNARISTISLCYAWEYEDPDGYSYYQDIYPYTKLNFPVEFLVNLDKAIDFNYQVYY